MRRVLTVFALTLLASCQLPPRAACGRRLRIVDETGAPVAGADVAARPVDAGINIRELVLADHEPEFAGAARYASGADGSVTLPIAAPVALVIARAGGRFGQAVIEFDDVFEPEPVLRLLPDRTLRVQVVGPSGAPRAEVPVELTYRNGEGRIASGSNTFRVGRSDRHGLVTLFHVQTIDFWPGGEAFVELRSIVLGAATPSIHVPITSIREEPVVVPCPENGSLRVRAWVAEGIANTMYVRTSVCVRTSAIGTQGEGVDEVPIGEGATPGEWRVLPVALGLTWTVWASNFEDSVCIGPTRDGEEVLVDLAASGRDEVLVGMAVVQLDGRPCVHQDVRVITGQDWRGRTDGAGRLFLLPEDVNMGNLADGTTVLHVVVPALEARGEVLLPRGGVPAGGLQLPRVQLHPAQAPDPGPLLATGTVVDAATGLPIRATVEARAMDGAALETATHGDGSFELRGVIDGPAVLRATDWQRQDQEVPLQSGRTTSFALHAKACLRATILVDDDICVEGLGVFLRDGSDLEVPRRVHLRPGQVTAWLVMWEGVEALEVAGAWFGMDRMRQPYFATGRGSRPQLLARVPRAQWREVKDGFEVHIGLRGRLDQVMLSTVDPDLDGWLLARAADSLAPYGVMRLARHMSIAISKGKALYVIAAPVHACAARFRVGPGEHELAMPPLATVEVEVQGGADAIGVRMLECRDPLWASVHAAFGRALTVGAIPRSLAELDALPEEWDYDIPLRVSLQAGKAQVTLNELGRYLLVPYAGTKPQLDRVEPVEIIEPGQTVRATIRR